MADATLIFFCLALATVTALMALFAFSPAEIKPTALTLNLLVSSVVSLRFVKAGHVSLSLAWPFLVGSAPAAFIGGYLTLPSALFNLLLAVLLFIAGIPLLTNRRTRHDTPFTPPGTALAVVVGAVIGLVSGLTGMGGGILLAPLLLYFHWSDSHTAAGLSAIFILFNSALALLGHGLNGIALPTLWPLFALTAVAGGALGALLGATHLNAAALRRILGVILLVAAARLLLSLQGG